MKKIKKEQLYLVGEGLFAILFGILIAIFGGADVIDKYFGITLIVLAVLFLLIAFIGIANKKEINAGPFVVAGGFLAMGIALLAKSNFISFNVVIYFIAYLLFGAALGLVLYGLYLLIKTGLKKSLPIIIFGTLVAVFSALFIWVDGFQQAFWIVIGVVIALYGVYMILSLFIDFDKKKNKK